MKPNLFNIATSELSQDGFLTWLLQWGDNSSADENKDLHDIAQFLFNLSFYDILFAVE
jgi:hypothetical protein